MSFHSCSQVLGLYLGLTWNLLRTYCESIDVGLLTISPECIPNASRTHRRANRLMKIEIALQLEKTLVAICLQTVNRFSSEPM